MKIERLRKVPKILEAINNDELRNDGRNERKGGGRKTVV